MAKDSLPKHHRRRQRSRGWRYVGALLVALLGLTLVSGMGAFLIPLPAEATTAPTLIYDRSGQLIGTLSPSDRVPVSYQQVPLDLQEAIVATEDKTFWTNLGVNPVSLARAALVDVTHGGVLQGGSTLTQQLAKNLFLTDSRTLSRKFAELFLALRLTATFPKRDILTMYLNTVYFGEGAWGLGRAAEVYFGVSPKNLSLPQAATLAGLVAAPTAYDPYHHPALARSRRAWVLERMASVGYITKAQETAAWNAPLALSTSPQAAPIAPYAFDAILEELQTKDPALASDLTLGGYRIYTTLDLADQRAADQAMADQMPPVTSTWEGAPEPEGALVSIDPSTGGIRALVGGRNYQSAPFDRATNAIRQVGSSFKPFLYSTLIQERHYTAASIMNDAQTSFVGVDGLRYTPQNAGGEHLGTITVRRALAVSDNVVAIKWADIIGPEAVISTARKFGITVPLPDNLTVALGSGAMSPVMLAQAFSAFPDGGVWHDAHIVDRVVGPSGSVVYRANVGAHRAVSPQVAFIMTQVMQAVFNAGGTGQNLANNLDFQVAGKTGTTNSLIDGWFTGFSSRLVTSVWVGFDDPNHPLPAQGAGTAGPIWSEYMQLAENQSPPPDFARPPGVVRRAITPLDGLLPNNTTPSYDEWFLPGTEPRTVSPIVYTGPWQLYPKNPSQWYFAYHGAQGHNPLWVQLMQFPGQGANPSGSQGG